MFSAIVSIIICLAHAPVSAQVRSDFDGDGVVGFSDFISFAAAFGSDDSTFDLDSSGVVDFADFLEFSSDYTAGTPSPHWIFHDLSVRPSGRRDHSLTLDTKRNRVFLFGGKREGVLDDAWILDLRTTQWRSVGGSRSPGGRRGHTAIYDADRDRVVVFGGETDSGFLNDVWAFDLETETWAFQGGLGSKPVPRYGLSAILDPGSDRMVISHGFSSSGRFDDTWAFDLETHVWSELRPGGDLPQARCLHDMVIDSDGDHAYLFGGCSSGIGPCPRGDLWRYDLVQNLWTELSPEGDRPTDRANLRLAYDTAKERVLLFAGSDVRGTRDIWALDPEAVSWKQLEPTGDRPPVRWSSGIVFDSGQNRLLMFGGTDGAIFLDDFWELRF